MYFHFINQDQLDGQCAIDVLDVWHVIAMSGCQGAALMPGEIYRLIDIFQKEPPEFKIGFIVTGGQAMKEVSLEQLIDCNIGLVRNTAWDIERNRGFIED